MSTLHDFGAALPVPERLRRSSPKDRAADCFAACDWFLWMPDCQVAIATNALTMAKVPPPRTTLAFAQTSLSAPRSRARVPTPVLPRRLSDPRRVPLRPDRPAPPEWRTTKPSSYAYCSRYPNRSSL